VVALAAGNWLLATGESLAERFSVIKRERLSEGEKNETIHIFLSLTIS